MDFLVVLFWYRNGTISHRNRFGTMPTLVNDNPIPVLIFSIVNRISSIPYHTANRHHMSLTDSHTPIKTHYLTLNINSTHLITTASLSSHRHRTTHLHPQAQVLHTTPILDWHPSNHWPPPRPKNRKENLIPTHRPRPIRAPSPMFFFFSPIAFKVQTSSPHKFLVKPPNSLILPLCHATFHVILKPQA